MSQNKILTLSVLTTASFIILTNIAKAGHNCPNGTLNITCWECGTKCTANLVDDTLTVSGEGEMNFSPTWNGYGYSPWAKKNDDITNIVIENGITSIGDYAFQNTKAQSVSIPNSVTKIGERAFQNTDLRSLDIPDSVTEIGNAAFHFNMNLQNIVVGNSVASVGEYAFAYNYQLKGIVIPKSLTSVGMNAFFNNVNNMPLIYCSSEGYCPGNVSGLGYSVPYAKDKYGIYDVNGVFYASAQDIVNIVYDDEGNPSLSPNSCSNYNECKIKVLQNKNFCDTVEKCQTLIDTENNNQILKIGHKFYESLSDLIAGNYIKKRIYTVDEANQVAGNVNTIRIKYR